MEEKSNNGLRTLKAFHGIGLAVLFVLMMLFVATPIQMKFGMYGVAITELIVLAMGIIPAIILKADLKEVFPIKVPALRQLFGTLIMWLATYFVVTLITLIIGYFFPESLNQVSTGLNEVITSIPMLISFFIVAIMPAICEEVLTRGFIQASFHSFKNKWSIVILVGVIFGIFHLDFVRFFPTAILGGTMAYIMFETKNLVLPMFLHFINNGLSTLVSFLVPAQDMASSIGSMQVPMASIGSWFIVASAAPFAFLLGSILIHKKGEKKYDDDKARRNSNKMIYVAATLTVIMLIIGFVIMRSSIGELIL